MRLSHFAPPSSPIPHKAAPTPLARSPTSLLGLTASQRRRRANTTRASSSEPTVAYGLANWRRQPKKPSGSGTGTGTASTGSTGTSGRGKKGAGMGMQGTPAKKGKRSYSKSMGAHSTPAIKIHSRSKSHSTIHSTAQQAMKPHESTSSLDSSFPSSAEFFTPSPMSQIPDLSSPSIPAILPPRRRLDVFDSAYVARPRERKSAEVEDWEALVQQAEEEIPEETGVEEEADDLYGWKQDTMWSLQGSSASTVRLRKSTNFDEEDEEETGTVQEHTIYNDLLITMNDQTRPSLSSRTQARSSTIKNRQPTPRKSHQDIPADRQLIPADRQLTKKQTKPSAQTPGVNATRVASRDHDISDALLQETTDRLTYPSFNISLNDRTRTDDPSSRAKNRAGKIRDRKSTPHRSSSLKDAPIESDEEGSGDMNHEASAGGNRRVLSQLLESSHPIIQDNLSQRLQSTQSTAAPIGSLTHALEDISMEAGRTGLQHSMSPMSPLPDILHMGGEVSIQDIPSRGQSLAVDGVQRTGSLDPADMKLISIPQEDVVISPSLFRWHPYDRNADPVPYTPSSHLSPASLRPHLSPLSFITTPPASLHSVISPPRPARSLRHPPRSTRKGAWRGAEVLARMEAADRGTARYHMAFERLSPGSEDGSDAGAGSTRRRERGVAALGFEESELVLAAREQRLDHYRELEFGYELHVELVL